MSTFSIVLQSLILVFSAIATIYQGVHLNKLLWVTCKWSPIYAARQLVEAINYRQLLPVIALVAVCIAFFHAIGWSIMMVGYPTLIVLNYLLHLAVLSYWRHRHNEQVFI